MGCAGSGGGGASSGVAQGKDAVFQVNITGGWKNLLVAKSYTLTTQAETVEVTTINDSNDNTDGYWRDFDYDFLSYTIQLDGVMKITDTSNNTVFDLLSLMSQFLECPFKIIFTDDTAATKTLEGVALITNITLSTTPNAVVNKSIEFKGKGKYTIT